MPSPIETAIRRNSLFAWIALATGCVLLIPLIAMQLTTAVRWGPVDFLVMGALIFGTGSLFVLAARRLARKYWLPVGVLLALAFLYAWAELAVGIFANLGS